jgi:hypothetical protein
MNKQQSFQPLVDWLTYRSYEHNRLRAPHVPYFKWRTLYPDAPQFEEIFNNNLKRIQQEGAWGYVNG